MVYFSQLPDFSTASRAQLYAVDVPLPSADQFVSDVRSTAWETTATYAGLAVSVIGVALLIRSLNK